MGRRASRSSTARSDDDIRADLRNWDTLNYGAKARSGRVPALSTYTEAEVERAIALETEGKARRYILDRLSGRLHRLRRDRDRAALGS